MKTTIPSELTGKALHDFLRANKTAILAEKKALPKHFDAVSSPVGFVTKSGTSSKAAGAPVPDPTEDTGVLHVKTVANACNWIDSQFDLLLPDSAAKSIAEGRGRKHLHDHIYRLDAQVGDVTAIYYQMVALSELGLQLPGSTQCLIYESDVRKSYNERVYNLYRAGKVDQHSIGLQYVKLGMAINDEEDVTHYEAWQKYYPIVINKDKADECGFFFYVPEYRLLENSAVLFGSNELTPTLDATSGDTKQQPLTGTEAQPSHAGEKSFLEYLSTTQLLTA